MRGQDPVFTVSEFVTVFNQSLDALYPQISVVGEISNFRVSKNKWVYFDLKDEYSSVKFFGSVYALPGPLEDGLTCEVFGKPRLHNLFGFSVNFDHIRPVGEGSLKKASELLLRKLETEGLFAPERKRQLPYPPNRIGLITSAESAAISDFTKIINVRWPSLEIELADTLVQGAAAPASIVKAIQQFNMLSNPPEVLVIIRGGGSTDDLAAFSDESVVRAIASSRIPTMVAIGHEKDISLSELAADNRGSTPSNAAELLVPDRKHELENAKTSKKILDQTYIRLIKTFSEDLSAFKVELNRSIKDIFSNANNVLLSRKELLSALDPLQPLRQGYVIVRKNREQIKKAADFVSGSEYEVQFIDGKQKTKAL